MGHCTADVSAPIEGLDKNAQNGTFRLRDPEPAADIFIDPPGRRVPQVMTVPQPPAIDAQSSTEAHLRNLLEIQPVCLTRVAADGTFLAINEAALSMLGAERLEQILGTSLLALVEADHRDICHKFLVRVSAGERGSVEVDLTGLAGLRHTLQVHAMSHPAPDGLASALCTFRDVTEYRRLESAVVENATRTGSEERHLQRIAELEAGKIDLEAALNEQQARLSELATKAGRASETDAVRRELEENLAQQQTRLAEAERRVTEAEARLSEAERRVAEAEALAREASDNEASVRRELEASLSEHRARLNDVEQKLGDAEVRVRELNERDAARKDLEAMMLQQQARVGELEQLLAEAQTRALELAGQHQAERTHWQQRINESIDARARDELALRSALAELERRRGQLARAAELARDIAESAPDLATHEPVSVTAVARAMEPLLAGLVGNEVNLMIVAASGEAPCDLPRESLEQIIMSLTAGRRSAMTAGGQITIEVADVTIDDQCASERRGFRPGGYTLLALHATGPGVAGGLPAGVFGMPPDQQLWRAAGPGMGSVYSTIMNSGGYVWVAHEGRDAIAFELYLPRVAGSNAPAPLFA